MRVATQCQSTTPTKAFLPHQRVTTEGKAMKGSLLTSDIEKDKANEISEIIFQALQEADVKHRKTVGTNIVNALTSQTSLTREQAIEVLTALKDNLIPCAKIHY
ncbi:TPA: hypothetical protein ACQ8RA_001627 [Escherichia coli]